MVLLSQLCIEKAEFWGRSFERDSKLSLQAFAERSLGIFYEESFDVVRRFLPGTIEDAKGLLFRPSQVMGPQKGGSLIVHFRADSELKIVWHLYILDHKLEVVEPRGFVQACRNARQVWGGLP